MKPFCNDPKAGIHRESLYRFPWSKTDNPGGWIEVTDSCNMTCTGCYRKQMSGHKDQEVLKAEVLDTLRLTNCDCITIAGGEPLIYPHLNEIVRFIASLKVKPIIFSNGLGLRPDVVRELRKSGLAKMHIHIDSMQERPEWQGKNESELNALRQYYADMIHREGGMQCGFHVTVFRDNLGQIPTILGWALRNLPKVQHVSFIAYRSIPVNDGLAFFANGREVSVDKLYGHTRDLQDISITTEEMFDALRKGFPFLHPCAYLNGTSKYETYKFLIMVNIGTYKHLYGHLGRKTMELVQMFHHLFTRKYPAFVRNPKIGVKIFALAVADPCLRVAFRNFLRLFSRNPLVLFHKVYAQSIHLQQPNEVIDGRINLCDDCVNMMVFKGQLINSCRLDEYRMFNEPLTIVNMKT